MIRKAKSRIKHSARNLVSKGAILDKRITRSFAERSSFYPVDNKELLKNVAELDKINFARYCDSYKKSISERGYTTLRATVQKLSRPVRRRI